MAISRKWRQWAVAVGLVVLMGVNGNIMLDNRWPDPGCDKLTVSYGR